MKKCPTCNRTFSDDTLSFCLEDGALLSAAYDLDETLVMSEIPTVTQVNRKTQKADRSQAQGASPVLTYLLVGLVALVLGGGIVGVLLYRNNTSTVATNNTGTLRNAATKPSTVPTVTPTPKLTAQEALRTYEYDQGWSGGRANNEYSPNVSYYAVTNTSVNGDEVVMNYAWKDGVLRLTISGNDLTGTWHQSNGSGPISLRFADDFKTAKGTWSDSNTGETGLAFLRQKQTQTSGTSNVPTTRQLQEELLKEAKRIEDATYR